MIPTGTQWHRCPWCDEDKDFPNDPLLPQGYDGYPIHLACALVSHIDGHSGEPDMDCPICRVAEGIDACSLS